jgi:molybdopterin converting factor small subunit
MQYCNKESANKSCNDKFLLELMDINIEVQLYFDLAQYLPAGAKEKKFPMTLAEGTTIQNLLNKLALPEDITKVIVVNGLTATTERKLQTGDVVAIFPPMAGG